MNDLTLPAADHKEYRTIALIKRLVTEQGIVHWRKYAFAFTLMAVSAGCTAFSAYLIGDVVNEGYSGKNLTTIFILGGITFWIAVPIAFVIGVLFYIFELVIVVTIQAFIFAALTAIYIGSAIEPAH